MPFVLSIDVSPDTQRKKRFGTNSSLGGILISCVHKGRSINSKTDNPYATIENRTILIVMLLFNIISLQFTAVFPLFYCLQIGWNP